MRNATNEPSPHLINRRTLSLFALSSLASACGGSDGDGQPIAAPEITGQPQDASVQEGQQASFTVTLKDEAQTSFQWARNGTAIAGATQKSLSVSHAELSDNGAQFSATMTNAAGSVQSRQARLTVQTVVQGLGEVVTTGWSALPITNPIAVGADGSIYGVNYGSAETGLYRCRPDGMMIALAGALQSLPATAPSLPIYTVLEDLASGSIYVAEAYVTNNFTYYIGGGGRIVRIDANGNVVKLFESSYLTPQGLARDTVGNLYTVDIGSTTLLRLSPQGTLFTLAKILSDTTKIDNVNFNTWLTASPEGFVYSAAKSTTSTVSEIPGILRISPAGVTDRLYLGVRGAANDYPSGLGWHADSLYALYRNPIENLATGGFVIRRLRPSGEIMTVAGSVAETTQNEVGSPGKLKYVVWKHMNTTGHILLKTYPPVGSHITVRAS